MLFHCIGYAGTYPFAPRLRQHPHWSPMKQHTSSIRYANALTSSPVLEQDMLPPCIFRDEERPPLRLALCGVIWDGGTCYGHSVTSLLALQALCDAQWPHCLECFDGDFSLCYISSDLTMISLYRSITGTRELYYRTTDNALAWSTHPLDLFADGRPSLDDVDRDMAIIAAATGLADSVRSYYHQLHRLPPGSGVSFSADRISQTFRYDYVLREDNTHLPYPQATKRFREYVEEAVRRTFTGYSSCNLFVSGGLDTAIVAYEAARQGKEIHGYHWTWDLPIMQHEYARAEAVAQRCGLHFHPLNFQATLEPDGTYVTSMAGLPLPYNHAFYACFAQTITAVAQRSPESVSLLATGHLGDTLFQGDWADPFRPCSLHPRSLLETCRNIFAWYPRQQAWAVIYYLLGKPYDLQENFNTERVFSLQSLLMPEAFQRVVQQGMVDYRELQSDIWKQNPFEARLVAASLQSGIAFNAPLKTSILYRDAFPQRVILRHPFADRQLHEFCLSLGPQHRTRWKGGQNYTKFLMRLAYVDDLPPAVIRQEIRTPYAAISEQFCLRNRPQLADLFNHEAILAQWEILNVQQIQNTLASLELCQQQSRSLVRMAGVELWLQGLAPQPRLPSPSKIQQSPSIVPPIRCQSSETTGVIDLPPQVCIYLINGSCILFNKGTLQVSRLDETGTRYWLALLEESSWDDVLRRLTQPEESLEKTRELVYNFAQVLVDAGWIHLKQGSTKKEEIHAVSTDDGKPFSSHMQHED